MGMFNVMAGGYLGSKHGGSRKFAIFGAVSLLSALIGGALGFFGVLYAVFYNYPPLKPLNLWVLPAWLLWIPFGMIAIPWAAFWIVFIVTLAKDMLADIYAASKRNRISKRSRYPYF